MDTKTIGILLLLFCCFLLIYVEFKKRKTLRQLMQYLQSEAYGEYLLLLNCPFVKFVFPKYNQAYMKLNVDLLMEDDAETDHQFQMMLSMRTTKKQREDLVAKAFHFYIEQGNETMASTLMEEIRTFEDVQVVKECQILYDIYVRKSDAYISEMEEQLQHLKGMQAGMMEYLLSLQYENRHDPIKSELYLNRSKQHVLEEEALTQGLH